MITTRQMLAAARMWELGSPSTAIADELGINRDSLWTYIRNHRDQFPNRRFHMDVWRARLADCKGMTCVQIAMRYGVSESTVQKWKKIIRESELEHVGS